MNQYIRYFILGVYLFFQINVFAQEPLSETFITIAGDTITINPLPLSAINSEIEVLNQKINDISNKMLSEQEIAKMDSQIIVAQLQIEKGKEHIEKIRASITIKNIEDLKREWLSYASQYKKIQEETTDRAKWFETELEYVNIKIQTWKLTQKALKNEKVSNEILERINATINMFKELGEKLETRQSRIFIIQNKNTNHLLDVDAVLNGLEQTLSGLQSEFFVQDSPFLWNANDSTVRLQKIRVKLQESLTENVRIINIFIPKNKNRAIVHLFIILSIIAFLFILNKRIKQLNLPEEKKYRNAQYVTYHYIASTLLLGLLVATWLYPDVPTTIRELIILLLLIPSAFLLPIIAKGQIKKFLFIILFLFFINEILFFYQAKLFFARIALIIENGILIWVIYKVIKPKHSTKSLLLGRWWIWVVNFSKLFLFLLVGSMLSNLFGFMNLAILINKTVIAALLFAIVLSIFVIIINSTVIILLKSKRVQQSKIIFKYGVFIEQKLLVFVQIFVFFWWLRAILKSTGFLSNVSNWLTELIFNDIKLGSVSFSIASILGFFIVLVVTYFISKAIKIVLEEEVFPRIELPRGVPGAITMLTGYFIVGSGIFLALSIGGIDLSKFSLMAGALGVGIGFGLQNVVYNFISGLILAFERPVQIGDTIEVGNLMGNVKEIGIRSSTVRTFDGSEVIVPNGNLISKELINWSLSDKRRRREVKVSIEYGTHPQDVLDLLFEVASKHEKVLKVPKPLCLFDSFGESALNFRLLFWVPLDSGLTIQSEITMAVYKAIEEAGMRIPYPQHDLHIKSFDPTVQKIIFPNLINKDKKED